MTINAPYLPVDQFSRFDRHPCCCLGRRYSRHQGSCCSGLRPVAFVRPDCPCRPKARGFHPAFASCRRLLPVRSRRDPSIISIRNSARLDTFPQLREPGPRRLLEHIGAPSLDGEEVRLPLQCDMAPCRYPRVLRVVAMGGSNERDEGRRKISERYGKQRRCTQTRRMGSCRRRRTRQ